MKLKIPDFGYSKERRGLLIWMTMQRWVTASLIAALLYGCQPPKTKLVGNVRFVNTQTNTTYVFELPQDCTIFDKTNNDCLVVSTLTVSADNKEDLKISIDKIFRNDFMGNGSHTLSSEQISRLLTLDSSLPCTAQDVCTLDVLGGSNQPLQWSLVFKSGTAEKVIPAKGGQLESVEISDDEI